MFYQSSKKYLVNTVMVVCGLAVFSQPVLADEVYQMGALGDSITKAFSSGGLFDTPRNSWTTGHGWRVESHKDRLEAVLDVPVRAFNAARSGAETPDLDRQVAKLLRSMPQPDYVTLLIGANDICGWADSFDESLEAFYQAVAGTIEKLVAANDDVKVLLVPIPDMYRLWEVGKAKGCQAKWSVTGFCSALLGRDRTDADRAMFVGKWRAANDALQAVAEAYPAHVAFAQDAQNIQFEGHHISGLDCFHPSVAGQNKISEATWAEGWYE